MKYLLDVNVLVAWGWSDHVDHNRVGRWLRAARSQKATKLLTTPISELGFVRVSLQRMPRGVQLSQAKEVLDGMLRSLGSAHAFVADDERARDIPEWCNSPGQTTDAHLWALARRNQAQLATLDARIPDTYIVPSITMANDSKWMSVHSPQGGSPAFLK